MKKFIAYLIIVVPLVLNAQSKLNIEKLSSITLSADNELFASNKDVGNHPINTSILQLNSGDNYVHPLAKTGKILTFIGVPLMIIGGVMVANADALYYQCYSGYGCSGDPLGGFGILVLAAGTGLTGTGVTLWTIGSSK